MAILNGYVTNWETIPVLANCPGSIEPMFDRNFDKMWGSKRIVNVQRATWMKLATRQLQIDRLFETHFRPLLAAKIGINLVGISGHWSTSQPELEAPHGRRRLHILWPLNLAILSSRICLSAGPMAAWNNLFRCLKSRLTLYARSEFKSFWESCYSLLEKLRLCLINSYRWRGIASATNGTLRSSSVDQ